MVFGPLRVARCAVIGGHVARCAMVGGHVARCAVVSDPWKKLRIAIDSCFLALGCRPVGWLASGSDPGFHGMVGSLACW